MTKSEFVQRLTLQCLSSIRWDVVGGSNAGSSYAVSAMREAKRAAAHIEREDPKFFDPEEDETEEEACDDDRVDC